MEYLERRQKKKKTTIKEHLFLSDATLVAHSAPLFSSGFSGKFFCSTHAYPDLRKNNES